MTSAEQRTALIERCRKMRAEIHQIFIDTNHWNATHPNEQIDADPDGELSRLADGLDRTLAKEG